LTKLEQLKCAISAKKRLLVLFSGGLDSTVLAKLSYDALGEGACALTIDSAIIPRREINEARALSELIGIRHVVLELDELASDSGFAANPPDRCYRCRKLRQAVVRTWAHENDFETIADGMNSSDLGDYRPGLKASAEDGIWQPFIDLGLTKDDLRAMAKSLDLLIWDKPSQACLCSRFPYGFRIEKELLQRVEAAEEYVKGLGFRDVRVRHFPYDTAFVEVDDLDKALYDRVPIVQRLRELGFSFVSLDLEGFASGKMNRVIPPSKT
jgi:pyridinium-3,5-biscarboxylic acid mononucleotide sulfurtransferase